MQHVLFSESNGVATLTLNRADKKNALTRAMYQQLADGIEAAQNNPDNKVIVLRANGDSFTAGNDISDFAARQTHEHVGETAAFMRALCDCPLIVVAEVSGLAIGIGTTLLLHCDFVYAGSNSRFALPFVNLGLVPEYASSYLLPRLAGRRKASEWLLLGEPFDAGEALEYGLINAVVAPDELSDTVENVVAKLVSKPAYSLRQTKSLMSNESEAVHQQMNAELDIFIEALESEAAQEAFAAFLAKRPINPEKFK